MQAYSCKIFACLAAMQDHDQYLYDSCKNHAKVLQYFTVRILHDQYKGILHYYTLALPATTKVVTDKTRLYSVMIAIACAHVVTLL